MNYVKGYLLCALLLCGVAVLGAQNAPEWQCIINAGGIDDNVFGESIEIDNQGNQYVTGRLYGTATFGSQILASNGHADIFAAKLDPSGNWLWAVSAGGTANEYGQGISVDGSGNAYLTGYFSGTATFGTHTLTSSGDYDIFAARLDPLGNWLWAVKAGGTDRDEGHGT